MVPKLVYYQPVLIGDSSMKNNAGRIAITALSAVFAICGICSPLIAQNEGSWQLVKIQASSAGYTVPRETKDLPLETRERKGIIWQYEETGGARRITVDVVFRNLSEVMTPDRNVIALDAHVTARLSGPARAGREYAHLKCEAIVRSASGYENRGFPMGFDYRVNSGSSVDFSCAPRITNLVPKEDYVLEYKLLFDDSGNRFRGPVRPDAGDVTFLFHYKWMGASIGASKTTSSQQTVPLKLFWNSARGDNFTTATPDGERAAVDAGYQYVRVEGYVFRTQQPGTVPLKLYYSEAREDNYTTAADQGAEAAEAAGYKYVRVEGYVYSTQKSGTVALKNYWNADHGDNFTTATAVGERDALGGNYRFAWIEGYILAEGR